MLNRFAVATLLVSLSALAWAQSNDFWVKKDYKQWNEKECRRLLENSPWAQDFTVTKTEITALQAPALNSPINTGTGGTTNPGERGRENNAHIQYRVQFRSALPVRQALVRMQQLANNYDQMPTEQKQMFDERAGKLLQADFSNIIAVHVGYSSNIPLYDRELANYWQVQTNDQLKNTSFLIGPQGQKIPPARFTTTTGAGREFTFYFPRSVDGQPLVTTRDKTLKLEFVHPRISNEKEERVLLEFKVDKMLMNGAAVY